MRLIDADELQKQGWCLVRDSKAPKGYGYIREFKSLDKIPTAYDVDAIVAQLEKWTFNADIQYGDMDEDIMNANIIAAKNAIEIVKAGGIDV